MSDRYLEVKSAIPSSYVEHIEAHNGWEGDLGDELGYVVIWDKETIQDQWDAYEMADSLGDRWFPFGSNGGGEMLCFDLRSGGDAVFWIPYIGMADEDAMLRYESFSELSRGILGLT
jgi:hypothetical protein